MVRTFALIPLLLLTACPKAAEPVEPATVTPAPVVPPPGIAYPTAARGTVSDTYFDTKVDDPYRWLEDPDAPESRTWIEAQNKLTRSWIDAVPDRQRIEDRLTKLWNFERFGVPMQRGGRYFYQHNDGLQPQSVLFVADKIDAEPRVLLDPNTLTADGTMALAGYAVSDDGKYLAYATADAGSDWNVWKVRDVATAKDLDDKLTWVKFSGASWSHDNKGFYYARYPVPKTAESGALEEVNENQTLWYHKVGTPQTDDKLVYARPDFPKWGMGGDVSEDGKTLIVTLSEGTEPKNRVYLQDLSKPNQAVKPVLDAFDAYYTPLGNKGDTWYFSTDNNAPRGRVVAIDIRKPDPKNWKEIIPETQDRIEGVSLVGGQLIVNRMHDAHTVVSVFDLTGKLVREIALPGIGTAMGFGGKSTDTETFYSFSGFTNPTTIYRYDTKSGASTVFKQAKVPFDPAKYVTEQVFYTSTDGTKVPMFLTHRADLQKDGKAPTLLYGYGGFDISITPQFSVSNLVWLEMGGVYAVANIRGGGEYGRDWHEAGLKLKKQNVFDDFTSAARWLHSNGWTDPAHTAIKGGSNGGLLVGASITQHPELFGAAVAAVGVMDMLRYDQFTIGWAWASDYGTAKDSPEMFKYLYGYSPYHNAKPNRYPATIITTGDHDDRVVPAHSFKFAAAMQVAQQAPLTPILARIDVRAGHGAGKPTAMLIEEAADVHAFLVRSLGMKLPADFGQ